uniref:Kinesin-like protein 6 n=1 Tax=Phallusia mammillata TaxID=59560 RepID=A0A6F9DGG9_9ASCI|nr:kinesin-like protein KIF28P [Phallusia mammillata]
MEHLERPNTAPQDSCSGPTKLDYTKVRSPSSLMRHKKAPTVPKMYDFAFGPVQPNVNSTTRKSKKMSSNLKVAVRLRPFNERERTRNANLVIEMNDSTTIITDPEGRAGEKKFTFDYSYWSHDGYREREDGYLEPVDARYADQARVFDDLGKGVLENAWKGFNCSLFAYGQTGSGKSYSMVGYNLNKGIIPITCEELFKGIDQKKQTDEASKEAEYQVSVSMLEIYNETVKDLLNVSSFKKGGLKVREHQQKGFYVEGLQVSPVSSYANIEARIAEGTRNRTLAATNMNATSSRAHTIVAINFAQKAKNDVGKSMTKTSIINLVDLAGSERAESTGATGDRLKEGSMINKSLLCLGNCIKALADVQDGKKISVPFRDSILTRLLKNALGGNSKTIMIAALSPADINYEETLSTLRFADRAKSIKTKAVVNESPTDKLIREMKDEIKRLQEMLKTQETGTVVVQGISPEEVEALRKQQEEDLLRSQEEMENMNRTWQQRLEDQEKEKYQLLMDERQKQEARKTTPHLWNLNEDPMLTGMIVHFTPPGNSSIGNVEPATIILKGLSVQNDHALIENDSNRLIYLTPHEAHGKLLVNGKAVTERTELRHNDRVMFGSNHLYVFHHPQDAAKQEKEGERVQKVSFDSAQEEIAQNKGFDMDKTGKSTEDILLQEDLIQVMPMVNEANAMSEELDQKMIYEIALISPQARGLKEGRTEVSIKARNLVTGHDYMWDKNEFINRKYAMQEMYQMYVEEDDDWKKDQDKSPFCQADNSDVIVGSSYVFLQSLAYLMDTSDTIPIRDYKGAEVGMMTIEANPCNMEGVKLGEDDFVENPSELKKRNLKFQIKINKIMGLPRKYSEIFCRFKFHLSPEWNCSSRIKASANCEVYFEKMFSAQPVTAQLLTEIENNPITIQVLGKQREEAVDEKKMKMSTRELLAKEDGVMTYTAEKPQAPAVPLANDKSGNLKRQQSELKHLQKTISNSKKAQDEVEKANVKLRKENEDNKRKMENMQNKLDLIAKVVKEAKSKKETMILVARIDYILQTGKDLPADKIKELTPKPSEAPGKATSTQPTHQPQKRVPSAPRKNPKSSACVIF